MSRGGGSGSNRRVVREREREREKKKVRPPSKDRTVVAVALGARGMMNIKAGQAVRVDSTLSAREPYRPRRSSDQYFLCEKPRGRRG